MVRPDGTVAFDVNDRLANGTQAERDAAATRRQRNILADWLHSALPEAFPEIYGTVARDERGRITELNAVPKWTTDDKTERNGYPAGDDQAAEAWGVRFTAPGIRAVIDVDACAVVTSRDEDGNPAEYSAEAMIRYTVCRDTANPGGTEVWSGIECEADRDPRAYATVEEADKAAHLLALTYRDNPGHFTWNARPQPLRPRCQAVPVAAGTIGHLVIRTSNLVRGGAGNADHVGVHPLAAIGQEPANLPVVADHHPQARGMIQRGQVSLLARGQFLARAATRLGQERVIPPRLVVLGAHPPGDEILARPDASLDAHGPELAADHGTIGPPPGLLLVDAGDLVKRVAGFR